MLPAYVAPVQAAAGEAIDWRTLQAVLPRDLDGLAVLVHTGWDRYWGEAAAIDHPYLGDDAATALVAGGVTLVGTEALNVDATEAGTTHAHAALLGADVLIVENLTGLDALEPGRPYLLRLRAAPAGRRRRLTHPRLRDRRRRMTGLVHVSRKERL